MRKAKQTAIWIALATFFAAAIQWPWFRLGVAIAVCGVTIAVMLWIMAGLILNYFECN